MLAARPKAHVLYTLQEAILTSKSPTVLAEQQPFVPQDPQWDTLRKSILRNLKYLVIFILLLFPVNMMWKWYGGLTTWSPYPSQQFAMAPNQAVIPVLNLLYEAKYSCSQQAGFFSLDRCSAPTEQQCKILVHGQESICNQVSVLRGSISLSGPGSGSAKRTNLDTYIH